MDAKGMIEVQKHMNQLYKNGKATVPKELSEEVQLEIEALQVKYNCEQSNEEIEITVPAWMS
ncbi:hypothetical protein HYG86_09250 [Alkalicella caledoniensis]|uniref:Uncharacterized protein n=1 Tax=Alkalicella caledoniensis TaxID=2731377 RepID=A0A7G9W8D5_ALKCA|nr:hypothetical protein [Alkalicella caledoniensis]QNO14947.1 hypothetical protein HYG86_09250 [Alkalicella caledoniensis]